MEGARRTVLEARDMKQSTLTVALKGGGILAAIALITGLNYFTDPERILLAASRLPASLRR